MMDQLPDPALFDTAPEDDFDRLTRLVSAMLGAPVALLSLVDAQRQFFKSSVGLPEPWASLRGTPLSHSFCQHVVASGGPLRVEDARVHPLVRDNLAIRDLGVVAYLGEPVRLPSGETVGSLCAIDSAPRLWTADERDALRALADAAETAIRLRAALAAQARANEAAAEAQARAEATLARQNRFMAGLSHELRTPLNGVLGGVTLLEKAREPAEVATYGAMIRASARALQDCVDDLIAYSRLDVGVEPVVPAPFDPRAAIAEALGAVAAPAAEKGLRLLSRVDAATPALWTSDGRRVIALLVNLLGNAVKYTSEGSVAVSVGVTAGRLAFRVSDTGPGVAPADAERIFEPFERGQGEAIAGVAGTGLGLAIARETARRLGGALSLERSAAGEGATFLLSLPESGLDDRAA